MNHLGFVKLRRSELLMELCQDPPAIAFLILAGMRAKWSDGPSVHGLEKGEAMMGDFEAYGATRAIHRRVISLLEKLQILTIKTTNKGTVVKFTDSTIFEFVNMVEQPTKQPDNSQRTANEQPASNQQTTTNEEGKKEKKLKKEEDSEYALLLLKVKELGLSELWEEVLIVRKQAKAVETIKSKILNLQLLLSRPLDMRAAMEFWIMKGWKGFDWQWYDASRNGGGIHNGNGTNGHAVSVNRPIRKLE